MSSLFTIALGLSTTAVLLVLEVPPVVAEDTGGKIQAAHNLPITWKPKWTVGDSWVVQESQVGDASSKRWKYTVEESATTEDKKLFNLKIKGLDGSSKRKLALTFEKTAMRLTQYTAYIDSGEGFLKVRDERLDGADDKNLPSVYRKFPRPIVCHIDNFLCISSPAFPLRLQKNECKFSFMLPGRSGGEESSQSVEVMPEKEWKKVVGDAFPKASPKLTGACYDVTLMVGEFVVRQIWNPQRSWPVYVEVSRGNDIYRYYLEDR